MVEVMYRSLCTAGVRHEEGRAGVSEDSRTSAWRQHGAADSTSRLCEMARKHAQAQSRRAEPAGPGLVLVPTEHEARRQEGVCDVSHPGSFVLRHRRVRGQELQVRSHAPHRGGFLGLRGEPGHREPQPCGRVRRQRLWVIHLHQGLVDVPLLRPSSSVGAERGVQELGQTGSSGVRDVHTARARPLHRHQEPPLLGEVIRGHHPQH